MRPRTFLGSVSSMIDYRMSSVELDRSLVKGVLKGKGHGHGLPYI